jgi:hypothetical protein
MARETIGTVMDEGRIMVIRAVMREGANLPCDRRRVTMKNLESALRVRSALFADPVLTEWRRAMSES